MSQPQEIQFLINEIDKVLPRSSSDPLKLKPEDIAGQHRVLEKVQSFLRSRLRDPKLTSDPQTHLNPTEQEAAWRIAQAVLARIDRSTGYTSNTQEIDELEQRRDSLQREIRQLQAQQENLISEAVQNLTNRLQGSLQRQLEGGFSSSLSSQTSNPSVEAEYVEQLKQRADQMLLNLDSTLQSVFQALEQDVHAYQQSLTQGLQEIHNLGQQSEAMFSGYLQRLREQETDILSEADPTFPVTELPQPPREGLVAESPAFNSELATNESPQDRSSEDLFPFAGAELSESERTEKGEQEDYEAESAQVNELMNLDLEPEGDETLEESDSDNREMNWYETLSETKELDETTEIQASERPAEAEAGESTDSELSYETLDRADFYEANFTDTEENFSPQDATTGETRSWPEAWNEDNLADSESETNSREEASSTAPKETETIRQLTDLLVETQWYTPESAVMEDTAEVLNAPNWDEDFTPAAPEENLLVQENTPSEITTELDGLLDPGILEQLSEDLERFESLQGNNSEPASPTEADTGEADASEPETSFYVSEDADPSRWENPWDAEEFKMDWQNDSEQGED